MFYRDNIRSDRDASAGLTLRFRRRHIVLYTDQTFDDRPSGNAIQLDGVGWQAPARAGTTVISANCRSHLILIQTKMKTQYLPARHPECVFFCVFRKEPRKKEPKRNWGRSGGQRVVELFNSTHCSSSAAFAIARKSDRMSELISKERK